MTDTHPQNTPGYVPVGIAEMAGSALPPRQKTLGAVRFVTSTEDFASRIPADVQRSAWFEL